MNGQIFTHADRTTESCIAAVSEDQNYYGEITDMVRRFEKTTGRYIEKIIGQDRFAYAHSDTNDFYDLVEWSKAGGYFLYFWWISM